MKQVGDAFEKGEIFLVDLILSGEAMKKSTDILDEEILKKAAEDVTATPSIVIDRIEGGIEKWLSRKETPDGRMGAIIQFWGKIDELEGRIFRVVTLDDKTTIHNAFPDRGFKL